MPTLYWIGKDAVVNHHQQVPFHLLKDVPGLSCGQPGDGNLIVQGDNLVALKALLPYYGGQVKCIYIDPPYNTGEEKWAYNDNVNSPLIREWLGKVVGREDETLDRHDRWLCMMYPRLSMLRQLLSEEGVIVIHIDEHELANLIVIMDEIFGRQNLVGQIVWDKGNPKGDSEGIAYQHETLLVYARDKKEFLKSCDVQLAKPNAERMLRKAKAIYKKLGKNNIPEDLKDVVKKYNLSEDILKKHIHPYELTDANNDFTEWISTQKDLKGGEKMYKYINEAGRVYRLVSMAWPNKEKAPDEYFEDIIHPKTGKVCSKPARGWRCPPNTVKDLLKKGLIVFGEDETSQPQKVYFLDENMRENVSSILKYGGSDDDLLAKLEVEFPTIKPHEFAARILAIFTKEDDLVLDSFAGSGTTGHAVLELNKQEGKKRKFILIEMDPKIAQESTRLRMQRVITGHTNKKRDVMPGLGGGFRYCVIGDTLFDETGKIRETVSFADLARHVYFTETGEPLPRERVSKTPLLGVLRGVAVYLLYNGILGDKTVNGGNVLTRAILTKLPPFNGQKVIYCAGCLLGRDRLQNEKIIVRQTPYEIKVS